MNLDGFIAFFTQEMIYSKFNPLAGKLNIIGEVYALTIFYSILSKITILSTEW
jgi:hypothetical protein